MIYLNKNKYTTIELCIMSFILLNSFTSTLLINLFKGYTTIEILLSVGIYSLLGYILINLLIRNHSSNFIDNSIKLKSLKLLIILILIGSTTLMGIYTLFYTSSIIKDVLLPNTSLKLIFLIILSISTFLANKGLKSIVIASNLLFPILFVFFIISIIFNLNNIETINLLPISFEIEKLNFFKILILTFSPLFLILVIPKNEIDNFKTYKYKIKKTYIFFVIYLIIKILFIISILGLNYMSILKYPEITVFKYINIFDFIKRLEEILVLNIFIENFILLSLVIFYNYKLLTKIKSIKHMIIVNPIIMYLILLNINNFNIDFLIYSNILFIIINLFLYDRKRT